MDGARVGATPLEVALDACETAFAHLLKLVGDGGLGDHDDLGLVAVMQRVERLRNRHALLDHALVTEGEARRLPDALTQRSMAGVLAWALRMSRGEAARRVCAAEQLGARRSMTGEALAPLRPALAAVQETGDASPEQVEVCLRALATVDHRGFDPADVTAAEQLLAGFAVAFAPKPLDDLARQVVERVDPDGTLPGGRGRRRTTPPDLADRAGRDVRGRAPSDPDVGGEAEGGLVAARRTAQQRGR